MTRYLRIGSLVLAGAAGLVRSTTSPTPARADTIAFAPAEGLVLRKTFRRELRLMLESVGWEQNGILAPANDGRWIDRQHVVFTDTYGPLVHGRPARLRRAYETVRQDHEHDLSLDVPAFFQVRLLVPTHGRGVLEGRSVVFSRAEDADLATCAPGDGKTIDESTLEGLEEDADLRELLPWENKSVGDVWFTDVQAFRQLCWPGGAMTFVDANDRVLSRPVDQIAARDLDGTFRIEFVERSEVAGRPTAHLQLRCVLGANTSFEHDLSIVTDRDWRPLAPGSIEFSVRQDLELYLVATGTADWDLEGGHLAALSLSGKLEVAQSARATPEETVLLGTDPFEFRAEWSGTFEASVEVERIVDVARGEVR